MMAAGIEELHGRVVEVGNGMETGDGIGSRERNGNRASHTRHSWRGGGFNGIH
ncbi:MAG: hypothetical protein M1399_06220 [Actinobacteria bacterium]|nr:hypothetical protein [Actinomycetota bacterium]MCL5447160.1 hypothetical protein [Actinomycetota bacterium]